MLAQDRAVAPPAAVPCCSSPVLPTTKKAPRPNGLAASFLVDIPRRWEPRTNQSNGLRLLIFPQPLSRALKNQNAAPASAPCFRRRRRSPPLLFEFCTVHHEKSPQTKGLAASFLVDIPMRWEPRAKQSRTVALLTALCAAALFESCTAHHEKSPQTFWSGDSWWTVQDSNL